MTEPPPPPPPAAKRPAPPDVDPVEHGGVRYEQTQGDAPGEFGLLRAVRIEDGSELWVRPVYRKEIDPSLEYDVQEVHFTSMEVSPDGSAILVENEAGERFSVDPASGASTPLE